MGGRYMKGRFLSAQLPIPGTSIVKTPMGHALFGVGGVVLDGRILPGVTSQRYLPVYVAHEELCAVTHGPNLRPLPKPQHSYVIFTGYMSNIAIEVTNVIMPTMKGVCWASDGEAREVRVEMDDFIGQWIANAECHVLDVGVFACGGADEWSLVRAEYDETKDVVRLKRVGLPTPSGGTTTLVPYFPAPTNPGLSRKNDTLRVFVIMSGDDEKWYLGEYDVETRTAEAIEPVPKGALVVGLSLSRNSTSVEPVLATPIDDDLYVLMPRDNAAHHNIDNVLKQFPTGITVLKDVTIDEIGDEMRRGPSIERHYFETPRISPVLFLPDYAVALFVMSKSVHAVWLGPTVAPEDRYGINQMGLGALMPESFARNDFPEPYDIGAHLRMANGHIESFKPPYMNPDEKPLFYRHSMLIDSRLGPRLDFAPNGPGVVRAFAHSLVLAF